MPILTGAFLGFSTLLFIGPVFFYLLKSSIEGGTKAGVAVAIGIILGDIICVCLALFGFASYLESERSQMWFAGIGGVILLFFGLKYLLSKHIVKAVKPKFKSKEILIYLLNGFLINFVNPFVFAVWFGFYAIGKAKYNSKTEVIYMLSASLIIIFCTDVLKVIFAQKLSHLIQPQKLKIVYKVFGFIMVLFAIRLFYSFINLYLH